MHYYALVYLTFLHIKKRKYVKQKGRQNLNEPQKHDKYSENLRNEDDILFQTTNANNTAQHN